MVEREECGDGGESKWQSRGLAGGAAKNRLVVRVPR